MKLRLTALLLALPAVIFGVLVAIPAEALTYDAAVPTRVIAISEDGLGKVTVQCFATTTCKGKLSFTTANTRTRDYSVPAKSSRTVQVAVRTTEPAYPWTGGTALGDVFYKDAVLVVNQDYPRNKTRTYNVTTETLLSYQQLKGSVEGPDGHEATDVKVELVRKLRGGSIQVTRSAEIPDTGGTYSFNVPLGSNNSASGLYKLRISGRDSNGTFRSWYWRGNDGSTAGSGVRYHDEGTWIWVNKLGDFDANFKYGSITGTVLDSINGGSAEVTVAAPPPVYSTNSRILREYDFPYCGNIYGKTTSNSAGVYRIDFLPLYGSTPRYMVRASSDGVETWNTPNGGSLGFGSCLDVMNYESRTSANLLSIPGTELVYNTQVKRSGNDVNIDGAFSGFTPTSNDRYVTLREKIPGIPVLSSPVVAKGMTNSNGNANGDATIKNVPPGKYWVEIGRRTTCSAWYSSVYPDNNAYFSGLDRGAERWKTVAGKYAEYQKSYTMGYVAKTPPSGRKGWMYRGYCKALGTGTYNNTMRISNLNQGITTEVTSTVHKGAVVHGHVKRAGGKTNKEMMVRLSSSDGKRVIRTDLTDSSGNFYVAGLPSGTWTISVNSDSWRGIGRTFTGKHSISVSSGHSYSAGTLYFKG
jgi:hypothetical protein